MKSEELYTENFLLYQIVLTLSVYQKPSQNKPNQKTEQSKEGVVRPETEKKIISAGSYSI